MTGELDFRRAPIAQFWEWWQALGRRMVLEAIATRHWDSVIDAIGSRVDAIDPQLQWEFGPGDSRPHSLTLAAAGDMGLRRITEEWLRHAPQDPDFDFFPARQAAAAPGDIALDGHQLRASDLRFVVLERPLPGLLDVTVHHPAFAGLDERARLQFSFLFLDQLLGEDGVERNVGEIHASPTSAPAGALNPQGLREAAERMAASPQPEAVLGVMRTPLGNQIVTIFPALKRVDHLFYDHLLEVSVAGDPTTELAPIQDLSERLAEALKSEGLLAFQITDQGGRRHGFYVQDPASAAALARRALAPIEPELRASLELDWRTYKQLLGAAG